MSEQEKIENPEKMIVLKCVTPSEYVEIDTENFETNGPIVLVLGGNSTHNNKIAIGNGNFVNSLLGVFKDDVTLLSVNYNYQPAMSQEIQPILNIFKHLICRDGKRLELNEALKNMRRVTVFAHCHGSYAVLDEVLWQLSFLIGDLGYSYEEEELIMQQIVTVSFGSKRIPPFVSGVDVLSLDDSIFQKEGRKLARDFLKNLDKVRVNPKDKPYLASMPVEFCKPLKVLDFMKENNRCYIFPTKEGRRFSLIASSFSEHLFHDDHSLQPLRRDINWNKRTTTTPTGDIVSRCMGAVLCNSVANSMLNMQSEQHIPFEMSELREQLELIVQKINETEADYTL